MKRSKYFEDLKEGLSAAVKHQAGKIDLRTSEVILPDSPPLVTSKKIKKLREETLHVSQPVFASYLGVSAAAVKAWEQGQKKPSGSARRLIQILEVQPEIVNRLSKKVAKRA